MMKLRNENRVIIKKSKKLEKKGIKLIEVWDSEWHADKDRFKNLIQEVINSIQSPLKI